MWHDGSPRPPRVFWHVSVIWRWKMTCAGLVWLKHPGKMTGWNTGSLSPHRSVVGGWIFQKYFISPLWHFTIYNSQTEPPKQYLLLYRFLLFYFYFFDTGKCLDYQTNFIFFRCGFDLVGEKYLPLLNQWTLLNYRITFGWIFSSIRRGLFTAWPTE